MAPFNHLLDQFMYDILGFGGYKNIFDPRELVLNEVHVSGG